MTRGRFGGGGGGGHVPLLPPLGSGTELEMKFIFERRPQNSG